MSKRLLATAKNLRAKPGRRQFSAKSHISTKRASSYLTKRQTREKRGQPRGAARGQPGCAWGQSLGKTGAAGKGVNSPNLRKKGAANPTKQTIIILRGGAQFGSVAPARPRPRACPPPSQPLEFYFGALCKLWACNKKPSSSATTPWPFGDARAKDL